MSSVLTLEALKKLADKPPLQAHPVSVNEFGPATVAWIAELGANESQERIGKPWEKFREDAGQESNDGWREFVVAACLCSGQDRTFLVAPDGIAEAAKAIGKQNLKAVMRMYELAAKLNGLTEEDDEKNSPPAGDGNGTSPSTPDSPALESGKSD